MTPAERTYARLPGLRTCQACMHGSGKAAAVNRAPPATGVWNEVPAASEKFTDAPPCACTCTTPTKYLMTAVL